MYSQAKALAWTPKHISLIASAAFLILLVFNKSEWKIRFLDWGAGALVVALMALFFLLRGNIKRHEVLVFCLPLVWMAYAALATPFAYNISHHVSSLFEMAALTLLASSVVVALFSHERLTSRVVLLTVISWVLISTVLLVMWKTGYLSYEKGDFAGLFRNRNEFAVQTVIMVGLMLFFVRGKRMIKVTVVALSFILVASSLSTKGFLFFFFILFFPVFLNKKLEKKFLVAFAGLLVLLVAYTSMPNLQERVTRFSMVFSSPEELRQSESAFLRTWLLVEGGKLVAHNPVSGVGVANSVFCLIPPYMQKQDKEEGLYSHNNYIEMALNAGIVGLFLFYFPLIYIYFKLNKDHNYWVAIKTLLVLYVLFGVVMVQYNNFISIFLYCLIIFLYYFHKENLSRDEDSLHS